MRYSTMKALVELQRLSAENKVEENEEFEDSFICVDTENCVD